MFPPRWDQIVIELGRRETRIVANLDTAAPMLGRFELRRLVGDGGMGLVFEAVDTELGRHVAIKVCKFEDGEAATAIEHEARCLAKVAHPNVVTAHEIVRTDTDVLLVMEFVKGRTLRDWQFETAPSWREVLARYVDAGHGLAAVHAAGLEHGDFKPDNVLLGDDGRVRVVDFGIARHLAGMATGDEFNVRGMGTRAYMARERLLGRPSDARADVFSFCVSVWESLYGARPYPGETEQQLLDSMDSGTFATGRALRGTPDLIRPILAAGVSPRVDERPPSMAPLLRVLADVPEIEQRRIAQRRRVPLVSAVLGLFAVVVFQAFALQRTPVERELEPESRSELMIVEPIEPEPSIEHVMSLAVRGDPFGARVELHRLEERVSVDIGTMLRLACVLVDRARTLPADPREKTLLVADQVATTAEFAAEWNGTPAQLQAARSLLEAISHLR
jgi:serine/threonine protein kinase